MSTVHPQAPHPPVARRRDPWAGQWLLGVAIVLAAALAAAGFVAGDRVDRSTEVAAGGAPGAGAGAAPSQEAPVAERPGPAAASASASASAYYDLGGGTPAASPATRLGVAFLTLDDPFEAATAALGPPAATFPDIGGSASTWALGDGRLTVGEWGDGDRRSISSLFAGVPEGSAVRVSVLGAVIGASTLAQVVEAWGRDYTAATSPYDDYVVSYVECDGPYPVVVKFDQLSATDSSFAPAPGSPLWSRPVTSVFVAFADEPPGSNGCPAP